MSLRVYFCPIVGSGTYLDPYRAKAGDYGLQYSGELIPSNPDGSPVRAWTLIAPNDTDWSQIDADSLFEKLFDLLDVPDTITTYSALKTFLQGKTVGDIPATRRQALNTRLTNRGLDTSQVTLATTLWQVVRGIVKQMNGGVLPASDGIGGPLSGTVAAG